MKNLAAPLGLLLVVGCAHPQNRIVGDAKPSFAPCPSSPNCVSTRAKEKTHRVEAPQLAVAPKRAWPAIVKIIEALPRTRVTSKSGYSLQAEARSRLFGFVDDLELQLELQSNRLAIRSASRVGYSDLGVNRARVETISARLRAQGIVK